MYGFCLNMCVRVFMWLMVIYMPWVSHGETNPQDVSAINSLYTALGNPPLARWMPDGGDPCMDAWQGVACVYSNITQIMLNGANLGGELGDKLDLFPSIITLDLSNNHIGGSIPANLPSTMNSFILSSNLLTGPIPSQMSSLKQLSVMDLSFNNLSGQLPPSIRNLSSLESLHLQDNQLSGTLDVLQDLPLRDLNVENNLFSGPIPEKLFRIPNFRKDGNPFNTTVPPSTSPPSPLISEVPTPSQESAMEQPSGQEGSSPTQTKFLSTKRVVWIAVAAVVMLVIIALAILMMRCFKKQQETNRFTQNHKIDVFTFPREMFKDASEDLVISPKDEQAIDVRRMGAIPNPIYQEDIYMSKRRVLSVEKEHEINMTGMNVTSMPPFETLTTNPVVPTEITTIKPPVRSMNLPSSTRSFTVASLQQYTNSFAQENCIGEGMFGSVYLAELPDGKLLAVKKLDNMTCTMQSDIEFLDFVSSISKLQHANVVKLEGYCTEHGQRLLVFEYCSNGTLHDALHSDGLKKKLTWNTRVRMALGAARALEYLHEVCHPPIVHQNFKSANVLLDDEFAVHVSDSGFAPLISASSANQLSGQLLSGNGYGAPEFETGTFTCQSDVYSFGVMMLELLTGRKAYDRSRPRVEQFLVRWAIPQLHDIDALSRMVDTSLNGAYPAKSLSRFADIISLCVQSEPEFRPPMSEIVESLLHMIQREPPIKR